MAEEKDKSGPAAQQTKLGGSRAVRVTLGIACALEIALGFLPLFGGPGYEASLASGILLPPLVALGTGFELRGKVHEPFDAFCRGVANGVLFALVAFGISLVHGFRVGLCDPLGGIESFFFGPFIGCVLAGVWGAITGEIARRVGRPFLRSLTVVSVALAAPIFCIVVSVGRFYTSPMIFAFDPFVGYFSGSIYDTVLDLAPLRTYRVGSALTLFSTFAVALHLTHTNGQLRYQSIGRPGLFLFGILTALASLVFSIMGPRMGHYHTRETIAQALGGAIKDRRCEVVYSTTISKAAVLRFSNECNAYIEENEAWLGVAGPETITAFLFEDADEKQRLMGAADTNIAKPWRREVYVQAESYPHRVLGHEIMHVVAGVSGRGPFSVAGALRGLLPNPGLIEGVAVASNPRDEDLSPAEWARAMKDLGILPPLAKLFALGFFGENSSTAYTVSGAFVGYIHEAYGASVVRAWYGGQELPELTGKSWEALESAWHATLEALPLTEAARVQAKARFDRPSIFGRRCPRVVDACREKSDAAMARHDGVRALEALTAADDVDPGNPSVRLDRALLLAEDGHTQDLADLTTAPDFPAHLRDKAIEKLADAELARGDTKAASARYSDVLSRTVDESKKRTLHVKRFATENPEARDALVELLVGQPGRSPRRARANELLGALLVSSPREGLYPYLLARYYFDEADYALASRYLALAEERVVSVPRVSLEVLRLSVVVACAVGDRERAAAALPMYLAHPDGNPARRDTLTRLVERCGR